MARLQRDKKWRARLAFCVGTALAATGFLAAVVGGPQPGPEASPAAAKALISLQLPVVSVSSDSADASQGGILGSRFRTRGS